MAAPALSKSGQTSFPREIAPGIFWFSACLDIAVNGVSLHNHNSCYLVLGERSSALVDTCPPFGWAQLRPWLAQALAGRPLDYIFPTHPESPHMGNVGPLLADYPMARLVGDLRNYELYFPNEQQRFLPMAAGERLSLGGKSLVFVPAVVHDLPNTLWAYEPEQRVLFVSDGYPYTHEHLADQCAMTSEELPEPPRPEDTGVVIEGALGWTRHVDADLTIGDLETLLSGLVVEIIAPAHGGVITNPRAVTEIFKTGLRRVNGARGK
jgi:flavorubredoxin